MRHKGIWLLTGLALAGASGADWLRPQTRVQCLPGIPERDYKVVRPLPKPSTLTQGLSFPGLEVLPAGSPLTTDPNAVKMRVFSMNQSNLALQQCSISQVALTIEPDGTWIFNCRADQSPAFTTQPNRLPPKKVGTAPTLETNYIRRNQFFITVRCYSNFPAAETSTSTGAPKPALAVIGPISFWVQRGEPALVNTKNVSPDLARYYMLIQRVEFNWFFE